MVCDIWLLLQEADFYMYSLYSKNKPKSDDVMAESGSLYFAVSSLYLAFCGILCRVFVEIYRSTLRQSPPNKAGLKCPSVRTYVRPSTKRSFDFNEIWHVGRGRWVMHDGVQYDPIQG